jgi:predicted ATP-grasp superfamily ATP-dependent carboligase
LTPWCADLFADSDLERIATVLKVPPDVYPAGLFDALADAPPGPVIYTGALENRPDLLAKVNRPLWGNAPDVVRAIRCPERWTACLRSHDISCPAIASESGSEGGWLLKPRRSAAGFGIQPYHGQAFNPRTHFLQEWIDGTPCSAVFLGLETDAAFLGATEQLIGTPWLNATGFHYAGSVGPLTMAAATTFRWRDLGATLARAFRLRGLFGIDAILCDGVPWPIEINPRYTASMEILERTLELPLLRWHGDVFAGDDPSLPSNERSSDHSFWAKGILFARKVVAFPPDGPWNDALRPGVDLDAVEFADIPHAGDVIERGQPVLTLFASAPTMEQCRANLQEKARALDRRLWG